VRSVLNACSQASTFDFFVPVKASKASLNVQIVTLMRARSSTHARRQALTWRNGSTCLRACVENRAHISVSICMLPPAVPPGGKYFCTSKASTNVQILTLMRISVLNACSQLRDSLLPFRQVNPNFNHTALLVQKYKY